MTLLWQGYLGFAVSAALALEGKPLKYFEKMLEPLELEALRERDPEAYEIELQALRERDPEVFDEEKQAIDPAKVSESNINLQIFIRNLIQKYVSEGLLKSFEF